MSTNELKDFVEHHDRTKSPSDYLALDSHLSPSLESPNRPKLISETSTRVEDYGYSLQLENRSNAPSQTTLQGVGLGSGLSPKVAPTTVETEDLQSLADQIRAAMIHVPDDTGATRYFLPFGELERVCDYPNVLQELQDSIPVQADQYKYAEYVCGIVDGTFKAERSARKIFAILVLIGNLRHIARFYQAHLCDKDLPFLWSNPLQAGQGVLQSVHRPFEAGRVGEEASCFMPHERNFMVQFHSEQFQVLVPFIGKTDTDEVIEYQLHADTIMPYICYEKFAQNSAFSNVYKVKIHPDHHSFTQYDTFALKVLISQEEEDFEKELYAMRKMKPGKHVLALCATFKRGNKLSFLFPWAEGGNLDEVWKQEPSVFVSMKVDQDACQRFVHWIADQCAGLAEGLRGIHNAKPAMQPSTRIRTNVRRFADDYGIHGDLKPGNILLFYNDECNSAEKLGILKLADFGLTRFHTAASRSLQPGKSGLFCPTYASPEHARLVNGVSRKSDVWALGCVFVEFLTWAIRGLKVYRDFKNDCYIEKDIGHKKRIWKEDRFFKKIHQSQAHPDSFEAVVKESVTKCLEANLLAASSLPGESNFLTDFLEYIRDHMLVVNVPDRVGCDDLYKFLQQARDSKDHKYWSVKLQTFR